MALEPVLEGLASYRIKLAVNAELADRKRLYEAVMRTVQFKGLDMKVCKSALLYYAGSLGIWR